jgi:hypothetical protein
MSTITVPKLAANELPAQNVAEIAADMQQSLEVMLNWLKAEPSPVMYFEDKWVVSGEGAIAAIQHFSKDIATRCLARRGLLRNPAPASKTTQPDGKATLAGSPKGNATGKTAAKPAAKSKSKATAKKSTAAKTTAKPTPASAT